MFRLMTPPCALVAIVLALAGISSAQFEVRGQSAALDQPFAIAAGDFSRDGILDLAVAAGGNYSNDVAILIGRGDGTFNAPAYYFAGVGGSSIAAADLDNDGNLDLVVASQSGYIAILMGNGDGTFRPATETPPVPTFETYVGVGDFNGDGIPDLVALGGDNTISVLLGNGDGTFQSAVITQPSFAVQTIAPGQFKRGGYLDLATAGQFGVGSRVNILIGNGDGTFRNGVSYPGDSSPEFIAVADFNGDHKLDFAVANLDGVGVEVWLGRGDGTFKRGGNYATQSPVSIAAAELSGNGKIDLAVANASGGVSVLAGNGDGTFQTAVLYPADIEDKFVSVGDFNGDGKPDLAIADGGKDTATVLLNTGAVSFSPTTPLNFKKQAVGTTSAAQTVTLTNAGTTELKTQSITASAEFSVKSTCGARVAPGANCTITAAFSPTKQGAQQGTITIIDNASSKPQVIELLGTGT